MAPKRFFLPAFLWTIGIAVACLVSSGSLPKVPILGKDKAIHATFYFVFTVLWFLYFMKKYPTRSFNRKAITIVVFTLIYGSLIEVLQGFLTRTRKADIYDIMANVTGCLIAIGLLKLIQLYKNKWKPNH